MTTPLVSIVMPVYNGLKYLPANVETIRRQTYVNFEVICADDLSTDGSLEYLQQVAKEDSRFKVFKRESKGGTAVKGVAYALPLCRGEYEFYISQDDLMAPDLLQKCVRRAQETGAEAVLPDMVWYVEGKDCDKVSAPKSNYQVILSGKEAFIRSLRWSIHGTSLRSMDLVRRAGIDTEYFNSCEYAVHKSYLLANKVAFCQADFFYRQDNPLAISKNLHYFTFDVLYTDVRLLQLMLEHQFKRREISAFLKDITKTVPGWLEKYAQHKASFTAQQQSHIEGVLKLSQSDLLAVAKRNKNYLAYWRMKRFFKVIPNK